MAALANSLILELEDAVKSHSGERRIETLRRVTDLFLNNSELLSCEQIGLFDDVLVKLVRLIETKALVELSLRLAPIDNAPVNVIRRLARDDEIAVAGPVLSDSSRLTANDLIEVAKTKSQGHLLAISGRTKIDGAVTDALLRYGDRKVTNRLVSNTGAHFSEKGFETLVNAGKTDATLAENVGMRLDLPAPLLRELMSKATEAVRSRLLSRASPETQPEIRRVIAAIRREVRLEVTAPRDFKTAQESVLSLQKKGQLNEAALLLFADNRKYEEMVLALAVICGVSIEIIKSVMKAVRSEGLLIACKAADLKWATVSAILKNRFAHHAISDQELAVCKSNFIALSKTAAQSALRFWVVRTGAGTSTKIS